MRIVHGEEHIRWHRPLPAQGRVIGRHRLLAVEDRGAGRGAHRMSMLQDWDRGRPLEINVLADSIAAMRDLAGVATPAIDRLYALPRLRVSSTCGFATWLDPLGGPAGRRPALGADSSASAAR